jgi:hypothetical protein
LNAPAFKGNLLKKTREFWWRVSTKAHHGSSHFELAEKAREKSKCFSNHDTFRVRFWSKHCHYVVDLAIFTQLWVHFDFDPCNGPFQEAVTWIQTWRYVARHASSIYLLGFIVSYLHLSINTSYCSRTRGHKSFTKILTNSKYPCQREKRVSEDRSTIFWTISFCNHLQFICNLHFMQLYRFCLDIRAI